MQFPISNIVEPLYKEPVLGWVHLMMQSLACVIFVCCNKILKTDQWSNGSVLVVGTYLKERF